MNKEKAIETGKDNYVPTKKTNRNNLNEMSNEEFIPADMQGQLTIFDLQGGNSE